ncbi:MAG: hypothetical protein V1797_16600 [Pseudomonadota bacterium]
MARRRRRKFSRRPTLGEWVAGTFLVLLSLVCFTGGLWGLTYLMENWWFGWTWEMAVLILALTVAGTIFSGVGYYMLVTRPRQRLMTQASEILTSTYEPVGPKAAPDPALQEPKTD